MGPNSLMVVFVDPFGLLCKGSVLNPEPGFIQERLGQQAWNSRILS